MAGQTYTIDLEWENGVSFQMRSRKNQDSIITVVKTDENNHYAANRESLESICKTFFNAVLKIIGDEMLS